MSKYKAKKMQKELSRKVRDDGLLRHDVIAVHLGHSKLLVEQRLNNHTMKSFEVSMRERENTKLHALVVTFITNEKATFSNAIHVLKMAEKAHETQIKQK